MSNLPRNWPEYRAEIDALLRSFYHDYETRIYLKPVYYISGIEHDPELYPLLSHQPTRFQKRMISLFLKEQGRVPRSQSPTIANVWILPGAV